MRTLKSTYFFKKTYIPVKNICFLCRKSVTPKALSDILHNVQGRGIQLLGISYQVLHQLQG